MVLALSSACYAIKRLKTAAGTAQHYTVVKAMTGAKHGTVGHALTPKIAAGGVHHNKSAAVLNTAALSFWLQAAVALKPQAH